MAFDDYGPWITGALASQIRSFQMLCGVMSMFYEMEYIYTSSTHVYSAYKSTNYKVVIYKLASWDIHVY